MMSKTRRLIQHNKEKFHSKMYIINLYSNMNATSHEPQHKYNRSKFSLTILPNSIIPFVYYVIRYYIHQEYCINREYLTKFTRVLQPCHQALKIGQNSTKRKLQRIVKQLSQLINKKYTSSSKCALKSSRSRVRDCRIIEERIIR